MAALAILLQDREHVLVERDIRRQNHASRKQPKNQDSKHARMLSRNSLEKNAVVAAPNPVEKIDLIHELREEHARLARSLAEKEVLIKEVHHRVKNNLQIVASLLRLQAQATKDQTAAAVLRESQHRVEAMAMIHEQLYGAADLREVKLAQQARLLMGNLFNSFGVDPTRICGQVVVDTGGGDNSPVLGVDQAIPVLLILNELISNALKHAFPQERSGSIRVEAHSRDSRMELAVIDDGVGVPEDFSNAKSTTLGLQIVEILARQLRGTWELRRDSGTMFRLSFPER
jgi:two-component sensor histidine kinase